MARDRKRANRRRRPDGAQPPHGEGEPRLDEQAEDAQLEGTTPGSHPDAGLEDVLEDRGPEGTTPTPDPLKHSSPWVDEAKLAEAGAEVPEPGFEEPSGEFDPADFEDEDRAPDEADEYVPSQPRGGRRTGRPGAVAATADEEAPRERRPERTDQKGGARFITFVGHCVDELKRVQWPNRAQTGQGTAVTLGFVVLAGGYLGLMDAIWKPIVEAIL